jgi:phosphopantothenoylcysteine decarboxylase / phosphopantothenate---cysteine ligase
MGLALAAAAARRGADVTLIAANVSLPPPPGVRTVELETTGELAAAVAAEFAAAHVLLMAAAPADFRAAAPEADKIPREAGEMRLALEPTEDILAGVAADRRADQTVVGFAAETGDSLERARSKLDRKAVDAIVVNDVSRPDIGFDSLDNEVTIVERSGEHHVPRASKEDVAEAILDRIDALRAKLTKQT